MELTFTRNGREYTCIASRDDNMGPPWKEHDGHGDVSEWTTRRKRPGELVLWDGHGWRSFYDFAGACRIARRDDWDNSESRPTSPETKRQRAARAARADFDCLRGWFSGRWQFWKIEVRRSGDCRCCGSVEYLGGIDAGPDPEKYLLECAAELADQLDPPATMAAE